ncbi:YiiX family permuted papain-like enzyme [Acinetobacter sp. WCHAc060025]|uniref:YiiX family permuted papain-like enzyme n=1 Tax=Acinetobacter sp. WCHAc060025 TaxID=2518625 RepID=UPI0010233C89|nr:YiiX family permuted papain-like enzyme [Acinetobacter sp. WCHAc060025]RZG72642.1 YiiX family permuted papain-like enzyme [Acinetobacter sp. WCHAc060025]
MNRYLVLGLSFISAFAYSAPYKTGDIIFHTSKSAQSQVIQKATHSPYSHMGLIVNMQGQTWVLEAIQPVKYTPLKQWVDRGVNKAYVVKRYRVDLTQSQQNKLVKDAEAYLNKPYDIYFEWNDDAIYCSEIVWKAYKDALGIELAPLAQLKSFDLSDPSVKALMKQRYGQKIPLDEKVIAPSAIFNSKQLITVQ